MKYSIPSILILFFSVDLHAQEALPKEHIQLSISKSKHGSGDLRGIYFSTDYSNYIFKKLFIGGSIAGTIHDGETVFGPYLFIDGPSQTPITKSIRRTTGGFQLAALMGLSPIRNKVHELQFKAGLLGRFQSAQNYNNLGVSIIYTPEIKYILNFDVQGNQRSLALGYLAQLNYTYSITRKYSIGLNAGFQNDQQGDVITYYGFIFGRRF